MRCAGMGSSRTVLVLEYTSRPLKNVALALASTKSGLGLGLAGLEPIPGGVIESVTIAHCGTVIE